MRIFYSFLIVVCSAILILLPVADGIYDFRTDERNDTFTVVTEIAATNATVQLIKTLYDDDTSTISLSSNDVDDVPVFSFYTTATRALGMGGLAGNTTRTITATYDTTASNMSGSIDGLLDILPWIWIIVWVAFPVAGLAAIWTGRSN